jgi:hypothetical protein
MKGCLSHAMVPSAKRGLRTRTRSGRDAAREGSPPPQTAPPGPLRPACGHRSNGQPLSSGCALPSPSRLIPARQISGVGGCAATPGSPARSAAARSANACWPDPCRPSQPGPCHQIDCWPTARENLPREPKPRSGRSIHDRGGSDDRTRCRRNSDRPVPVGSENRYRPKPIARACGSVPWLPNGAAKRLV